MSLRLYDTRSRQVRPFAPLVEGTVGMYVCGPTVQAAPHVGHIRSGVSFDVLRRWLVASGFEVTYVRNVTDIDDKIINVSAAEGIPWWALAERSTRAFNRAYDSLLCLPPTAEPRATGHIQQILAIIALLIDRGHAYAASGDVYFDVRSDPRYGELSGQVVDAMQPSADDDRGKRSPLDFALWKSHKPGEPAWESPWGPGRPGWHIECSAMAVEYLGEAFDIHGGGLDLVFPHHENEVAQSTCAGHPFAAYWLHNGLVNIGGEKMSKSLGNSYVVADVLQTVRPQVLRYYLAAPHYRSTQDFTEAGLEEAATAYGRVETFVRNAVDALGGRGEAEALALESGDDADSKVAWDDFSAALDDDLGVPRALGAVHNAVRAGNALLPDRSARPQLAGRLAVVRRMLDVLGLDPIAQWPAATAASELEPVVDALVQLATETREAARARKDFASADAVRDRLLAAGIVVEDTAEGPRWRLRGDS